MSTCVFPAELDGKLHALSRRIRAAQVLGGVSRATLISTALFAAAFLADLFLDLSPLALAWMLTAFTAMAAGALAWLTLRPLLQRLDAPALAALVEEEYPELAERLTTTVELAGCAGLGHGSAALIAFLQQETALRASGLDFARAYPARASRVAALLALGVVGLLTILGLAWDRLGDFSRRFATAWQMRPPFDVQIAHANIAAKGRPWTVSARLAATSARPLPGECFLLVQEGDTPRRLRMQRDETGQFSATLSAAQEDFAFQIEAGPVVSAEHRVTAIEPADLIASSPTFAIQPPPYVNKEVHPPRVLHGIQDLVVLEYGVIRLDLRFTRAAAAGAVHVHEKKPPGTRSGKRWTLPLDLAADRQASRLALPTLAPGAYALKLTLEAEHGIITERELGTVTVRADAPPRLTETPGNFSTGEATPAAADDVLLLHIGVEDDIGVDRVELEYRINGGPVKIETILRGDGKRQVRRDCRFHVAGRVKDGDTLHFRLKAVDNRRVGKGSARDLDANAVPASDLEPQATYEPAPEGGKDRWFELQIRPKTSPLHEKEILAQRDAIQSMIEEVQKRLAGERARIQELRPDIRKYPSITPEQANQLTDIRAQNLAVLKGLQRLAEQAGRQDMIAGVENQARDIVSSQMQPADELFQKAQDAHLAPEKREPMVEQGDQFLATAQKRLAELARCNDRLAMDRLDHLRMEKLARQQDLLAKRAARLAGKNDPQSRAELAEIRAEQKRLREELERLTQKTRLFREGMEAAGQNPVESFTQQLKKLTEEQRALAKKLHSGASPPEMLKEIAKQKGEMDRMLKELFQLTQDADSVKTRELAMQALAAAEKAQQAMKQAEAEAGKGNAGPAERAAEDAAKMLDQAGQRAAELGLQLGMDKKAGEPDLAKLGDALKQGKDQTDRADMRLEQNDAEQAAQAMQKAAQAMQQSADLAEQRLTRSRRAKSPIAGTNPSQFGPVTGPLLTGELAKELEMHAGRPWGELPGELRTRIVNDLRSRYGDDFARIIQGYFESLSDSSRDEKK